MDEIEKNLPRVLVNREDCRHPWLSWKEVPKPGQRIAPGSVVDFVSPEGAFLGRGFFNAHARIRGRVVTQKPEEAIDAIWITKRIQEAVRYRRDTLRLEDLTNAYRVVNAEGDGMSGLVVDRFNDLIVIEYFSHGMFKFRNAIKAALSEAFPQARFYSFAQRHVQKQESFDHPEEKEVNRTIIREAGLQFVVAPGVGQKTGFFLDQRDNRLALANQPELIQGKSILDLCSHTGAFSIHALKKGAARAVTVDRDAEVLKLAEINAALNEVFIEPVVSDLFDYLDRTSEKFDVVILDPPKQTRSREGLWAATRRYSRMNELAMKRVKPGGLLVSCSCSGLYKEDDFVKMVRASAVKAGRRLKDLRVTGAAKDHPVLAEAPEGRYLKVVWTTVD